VASVAASDTTATRVARMPEEAAVVLMLQALGRYLTATCRHERQPDPLHPWLRVTAPPCSACATLRAALGLEEERPTP
jgi:hypothetical protein